MSEAEETPHIGGADQQRKSPIGQRIEKDRSDADSGDTHSTSGEPPNGEPPADAEDGGLSIPEVAAGYITALVLLVYPVGLLTFAAQLWTSYGYAPSTSFYAASLAPTAVGAGRVFHSLLWFLVAIVAVETLLRKQLADRPLRALTIIAIAVLVIPLGAGTPIITSIFGHTDLFTQRGLILYGLFVLLVGIAGFGGAVWVNVFAGATGWRRYVAFVPVYLTAMFAAIVLAGAQGSSLPRVELGREQRTEVLLLSHSQGYWYVFDGDKLSAIPDDKTGSIDFPRRQSESLIGL